MRRIFWIALVLLVSLRFLTSIPHFPDGTKLRLSGILYSEPSVSFGNAYFNLNGMKVVGKENLEIHYGDYMVVDGVYENGQLTKTKIEYLKSSVTVFANIRKNIIDFYQNYLPQPSSSLVGGIVIGAKSTLPQNFKQKLNDKGLSHIVVASGTNVTIVAGFILAILITRLSRKKTLVLTIISIWFYTLITGFEAPIVRASIMATIAFTAMILGKVANPLYYTSLTILVMLFIVPSWLTDVGFLLSAATTLSLILFTEKISTLLHFLPEFIKEDFVTSLSAQLGSFPIIYFFFGQFNLLSPILNVLVLWTIPIIMLFGGAAAIVSFVSPQIAQVFLLPIRPLLTYFIAIASL